MTFGFNKWVYRDRLIWLEKNFFQVRKRRFRNDIEYLLRFMKKKENYYFDSRTRGLIAPW
jgi:hypothetical protein